MRKPSNNDYFPLSEYVGRISRIRDEMRRAGMDALLISTEPNVVYFTGFLNGYWICTMHDDVQLVLIGADPSEDPVLLIPGHLEQAARTGCVDEVRTWTQFSGGASKGPVATVAEAFSDKRLSTATVGLETGPHDRPGMSLPFVRSLEAALPNVEWMEASDAINRVRKIKSPLEIEKMRRACEITCQAVKVGLDAVREGLSEKELSQIIALEMARLSPDVGVNHPWFLFIYGSGRGATAFDGVATSYRFQKGDVVYIDVGFQYQGYGADMIRCASIGKPDREVERHYYAARDSNMAAIDFIRPGITGKELYSYWTEQIRKLGFHDYLKVRETFDWDFLGHGIGGTTHELPMINSRCEDVLEPGMVMAIEGDVFDKLPFSETRCALKNEEDVLVTESGHEWLTPLDNDLKIVER